MASGIAPDNRLVRRLTKEASYLVELVGTGREEEESEGRQARRHVRVVLQVDDVGTMLAAVRNGLGIARMPCFIGDSDSDVCRIDLPLTHSDWGIWVLSHVDLRSTARVRVCREFLIDIIQQQRALVLGERSRYFA